jgi:hypothetical protein
MLYPENGPGGKAAAPGNTHGMTSVARRGLLLLAVPLALAGCPQAAGPSAPTPTPAPVASPVRSPSPSPLKASPRPSPSIDPTYQRLRTFAGTSGMALEGPFDLVAGDREFRCFYEGRSAITVSLIRQDGETDAQLFNRTGPFSDTVRHTLAEPGAFRLHVTGASGPWRLEVR